VRKKSDNALNKNAMEAPYDRILQGILAFPDFAAAECCLHKLENLRTSFRSACDMKGVGYCREIALTGRRRAELIARNQRVSPAKRRQKQEIAVWFRIWLETPEIFWDWLALRKETAEFQELAQSESPQETQGKAKRKIKAP
jgi:hypothetical protein